MNTWKFKSLCNSDKIFAYFLFKLSGVDCISFIERCDKLWCGVGAKTYPPRKHTPSLTLMLWRLKTIVPQKLCFFRGIHPNGLHFVLKPQVFSEKKLQPFDCLVSLRCHCRLYNTIDSSNDNTKLTITFFSLKIQTCGFNTKCRPLGCIPLKKHNFWGTIVFKCHGIKVSEGGMFSRGYGFASYSGTSEIWI